MNRRERFWFTVMGVTLAWVTVSIITTVSRQPPPPEKDWCRDQFGTERPMEFCHANPD